MLPFRNLQEGDKILVKWTSDEWNFDENLSVCEGHFKKLRQPTKTRERPDKEICCDPFARHKKEISSNIRTVSAKASEKAKKLEIKLAEGDKCCHNCCEKIMKLSSNNNTPESSQSQNQNSQGSDALSPSLHKEEVNRQLHHLRLSPIENPPRSTLAIQNYVKRKVEDVKDMVSKKICLALSVPQDCLTSDDQQMARNYENILQEIKHILPSLKKSKRIQFLTLCPDSWTITYAAKYFNVSRYLINRARVLRNECGILADPAPNYSKPVSDEVKRLVKDFFEDDRYSRLMPGRKDCVSIGGGEFEQKRMLLCTLKELYKEFRDIHPNVVGFSLFCSLKPKSIVFAGSSGTHNVCVCKPHQNIKLILYALGLKENYKELIPQFVCESENRICRLRLCSKCPNVLRIQEILTEKLKKALEDRIQYHNVDEDEDSQQDEEENQYAFLNDNINYKQWTNVDQSDLTSHKCKVSELIEIAAKLFLKLIPHDYTAKKQAEHFKALKENLKPGKAIIVMDFSMNYSCLIQDATQSFHWSKKQVTVHPVVIYYRDADGNLVHKSICFISNDLEHDVHLVREMQQQTLIYIKEHLIPNLVEVEYITDGCAAQYKGCKSFLNLCQHREKFGIHATHSFFATSHGKSACDGVGGFVKRVTRKASLQRPLDNQIINAQSVFKYCQDELVSCIHFIYIEQSDVQASRLQDLSRALQVNTIPGTMSFHNFVPLSGKH